MNRQGQVFLLLTILSITFLLAISTVLLDIQQSEYSEPSADSDKLFEAWDNSITTIEQVMSIQIAENTNNGVPDSLTNDLPQHMNNLEMYLNSKGLIATIEVLNENYDAPELVLGTSAIAQLTATIYLYISTSSGANLESTLTMDISYSAVVSNNILVVQKIVNSIPTFINNAEITPPGGGNVQNNGNGSYNLSGTGIFDLLTFDNIFLQVQL